MLIAANRAANRTTWPRRAGWAALAAFVLAAAAAGSAVYWALKWPASKPAVTSQLAAGTSAAGADPAHLARALGDNGTPSIGTAAAPVLAAPSISSRLNLVGVVANTRQGGSALISIDGKPARPFRVGAKVEGEWSLQSVAQRRAVLSSGSGAASANNAASVTLDLPPLKSR